MAATSPRPKAAYKFCTSEIFGLLIGTSPSVLTCPKFTSHLDPRQPPSRQEGGFLAKLWQRASGALKRWHSPAPRTNIRADATLEFTRRGFAAQYRDRR